MTDKTAPELFRSGVPRIVIVGGGLAGALFTLHLIEQAAGPLRIDILEERCRLGAGLAYSTERADHITNIPAARMGVRPDDPEHFVRWLKEQAKGGDGSAPDYPPRALFGRYIETLLDNTRRTHPDIVVQHHRTRAASILRDGDRYCVETVGGGTLLADSVGLATGNPAPALPQPLAALAGHPGLVANPWAKGALDAIGPDDRVLLIGTGLTTGDTLVALRSGGHSGPVVALSRHGLVSRRGMLGRIEPVGDFRSRPPRTALGLLRLFRSEIVRAVETGSSWHAVLQAARLDGWGIWQGLPQTERRRFVRHLKTYWEVHRHVMPGPVHDLVIAEQATGRLTVRAGRLQAIEDVAGSFDVAWHLRGQPAGQRLHDRFDAIVNCTGPNFPAMVYADDFWSGLVAAGLAKTDPDGFGVLVDSHSRLVSREGVGNPGLLALGTLARGAFGELTGAREIAEQTRRVAHGVLDRLGPSRTGDAIRLPVMADQPARAAMQNRR